MVDKGGTSALGTAVSMWISGLTMAVRGGFWIGLILLCLLGVVIITLMSGTDDGWCNLAVNAGDCQIFGGRFCYCIATFGDAHSNHSKELGIYERSEERCHALNGTLAVPDQEELVIWLAKRMFDTGVDKALVGLRMIGSSWFWMHQSGAVRATKIIWRQDFPAEDKDSHAMITVETARKDGHNVDYYYGIQYLNYDYYIQNDRTYQWFGFTTRDDAFSPDVYFVCRYTRESLLEIENKEEENKKTHSAVKERSDPCLCSADEQIELSTSGHVVTFQTPRYPSNYCSDSNCRWIITINVGYAIKLEWIVFSTEHLMDFVFVYDGPSDDSPLLASCSGSMCTSQRSSTNQMQVHFHSDHVTTDLGFKAKVTGIEHDECFCSESSSMTLVNLHDTFTLFSPKFPQPYCVMHQCGWTIETQKENGLQLHWNFFDTDPDADFVYVYNEEKLVKRCSGKICSDFITSGNQLRVEFITDAKTSHHTGIQATVTVVINYCKRLTLAEGAGSASYSSIRDDGNIPAGANATFTCPNNTKVQSTNDQTTDVLTCEPPIWNREPECVSACHVQFPGTVDLHNIHFCTWQETPRHMIEVDESIVLERYDLISQSPIGGAAVFECTQNGWSTEQPSCNEINERIDLGMIALIGREELSTIQSFNPANPSRNLLTSYLDELHEGFIALPHDGKVLIAGGTTSALYFDMQTSTFNTAPEIFTTRYDAGATIFGEVVVVCGGYENMIVLSSCEQLKDHQWLDMSPLTEGRYGMEMLSVDQNIYIVGGWLDKTQTPAMGMEQWDVSRGWFELETTPPPRHAYKESQESSPTSFKADCLGINDYTKKVIYLDDRCFVHHTLEKLSQKASQDRCAALYPRGQLAVIDQTKMANVAKLLDLSNGVWTALLQGPDSNAIWQTKINGQNKTITLENLPWASKYPKPSYGEGLLVRYDGFVNAQLDSQHSFLCQFANHSNKTQVKLFAKGAKASNLPLLNKMSLADAYVCGTACIDELECRAFSFSASIKRCELYAHIGDASTIDTDTSSMQYNKALLDTDCISLVDCFTDLPKLLIFGGSSFVLRSIESYYFDDTDRNELVATVSANRLGHLAVLMLDNKVLIAGGATYGPSNTYGDKILHKTASIYDPSTKEFTPTEDISTIRYAAGAVLLNGVVVICGGYDQGVTMSTCEQYSHGQWSTFPSMKVSRHDFPMFNVDNKLFAIGGYMMPPSVSVRDNEKFDPKTNTWEAVAPMISADHSFGGAVFHDQIYTCGDADPSCNKYDPITDHWSSIGPLMQPRWGNSMFAFRGKLYVISGQKTNEEQFKSLEVYDVDSDQWSFMPTDLIEARVIAPIVLLQ